MALKKISIFKWFVLAFTILALGWTATSTSIFADYFQWEPTLLGNDWTQIVNGEEIFLEQVMDYQEIPVGDTLVLTVQLPTILENKALYFYSKDVEVRAYIDDILVYCFEMEEDFSFLKTPGHSWNFLDLPTEYSGQTLRLELTSQFANRFDTTLSTLYFINEEVTIGIVLMEKGLMIFVGLMLLLMALICYIYSVVWKRRYIKSYYLALGNFYLSTSVWTLTMSAFTNFLFHKPTFTYLCSIMLASFIPVTLYELVKILYGKKGRRLTALGAVLWGSFTLQFFLQFAFGISMLDMLFITIIAYAIGCVLGIWMLVDHYFAFRGTKNLNILFMSIFIMIGGEILELLILVIWPERTSLIGATSLTGLVLYLVVNQIYLTHQESTTDMNNMILEQNNIKLQNTGLMHEIKSHFFFNTLNTISALCKSDPEEADRAIVLFAQYMRSHMHLINQHKNIPFEMEMNLVESTLDIEAVRFPNSFTYSIDTPHTDFFLPPFTVQPIVENALVHGLRGNGCHGKVEIHSHWENGYTVVTVEDNGMGFDVSKVPAGSSLGIKNLTKRVELMAKGTVQVESQLGQGTKVTLRFPHEV